MSESKGQDDDVRKGAKLEMEGSGECAGGNTAARGVYSMYLTNSQAATFIAAISPNAARNILEDLGVRPIDFGSGRGRGLRWVKDEIIIAMDKRRFGKKLLKAPKKSVAWDTNAVLQATYGHTQAQ
jgi:hypothetical protein